jgi:hypothetical protein
MGREMLSVLLASLFFIEPAVEAKASQSPQAGTSEKTPLQQRVLEIPAGTLVEVRLKNKEKLRGRLGEVSEDGFQMQVGTRDKSQIRKINFDELKSIKELGGGSEWPLFGDVAVGALLVGGVALVIMLIKHFAVGGW